MTKIEDPERSRRVALGLSGGVDSAVSAYLLKKSGYDVSCIYLNCYDADFPGCRARQDRKDALAVAMHLGLPFQVLDFRKEYQAAVIDYFKKEYESGRTPNPDIVCNREIKFGLFYDWAIRNGFDFISTGHYANVTRFLPEQKSAVTLAPRRSDTTTRGRRPREWEASYWGATSVLRIPKDERKDQTYFLWQVPRERFEHVLFPLGDLLKSEVRAIAKKIKLPVAEKKDSTGICFIGEVRVEDFLKRLGVKEKEGEVAIRSVISSKSAGYQSAGLKPTDRKQENQNPKTDNRKPITEYQVIGSHRGVWFYTIGQRHGFDATAAPSRQPLYVIEKDVVRNRLVVGFGAEGYCDQFVVSDTNWLVSKKARPSVGRPGLNKFACLVRIRHGGELIPCSVTGSQSAGSEQNNGKLTNQELKTENRELITVFLATPQRGIAPGQSAVFYLPGSPWRSATAKPGRSGAKAGVEMTVLGGGVIQP